MVFAVIMLVVSLSLAGMVAYAAVYGFMAIFVASPTFALLLGIAIEAAKLTGISYLYRSWHDISRMIKYCLLLTTTITILLSAIGLFGFLTRAHLENQNPVANNSVEIAFIEQKIQTNEDVISSANAEIEAFNAEINKLIEFDKVSGKTGSKATRAEQEPRRAELNSMISEAQDNILELRAQKFELDKTVNSYSTKIGPIMYVAEMVWGTSEEDNVDRAVRLLILIVMIVLDPMAILLLMGANALLMKRKADMDNEKVLYTVDEVIEAELDELDETDTETEIEDSETKVEDPTEVHVPQDDKMDQVLDKMGSLVDSVDELKNNAAAEMKRKAIKESIRKNSTE